MGVLIELQGLLLEMRSILIIALALLPALVIGGKEEKTASTVDFQPICDFHNREIDRLESNIEELAADVVTESALYKKLTNSSKICSVIGYLALPECATKEGLNVFEKLDDKCAENKTNSIRNSLLKLLRLEIEVSGQAIFRSCKDIVVKQLKGQFEKMLELISGLCDQSSLSTSTRRKRSYGGGYGGGYHGGYDPATIWFQYLLCHEQKITCYFFTDGWNDKQYGQYYLYQNVLDTGFDSLGDDDDLLALLLLPGGGLQQYPHQGYPAYPSYRKRREVEEVEDAEGDERRRRNAPTTEADEDKAGTRGASRRRRTVTEASVRSITTAASINGGGRKLREDEDEERRRRSVPTTKADEDKAGTSGDRRRRRNVTKAPVKSTTTAASINGGVRKRRFSEEDEFSNIFPFPVLEDEDESSGDRRRRRAVTKVPAKSTTTAASVNDGGRKRRSTERKNKDKKKKVEKVKCEGDC